MGLKKRIIIGFFVSMFFLAAGLLSCQGQIAGGSVGSMSPDFMLKDVYGNSFRFGSTRGKVVILDFWATWCPPCRMEIPHFQALYEEYGDQGLVVVGVALDRGGVSVVKPFAEDYGVTYPVVIGDGKVAGSYGGVRGIPTTFVIDRAGRIAQKYVGYRSKEVFEAEIKKLL